jgi:hypothetical protein
MMAMNDRFVRWLCESWGSDDLNDMKVSSSSSFLALSSPENNRAKI